MVEDCFLEPMGRSKTAGGAVGDCSLSSRGGRKPLIAAADGFSLEWRTAKCRSPQFEFDRRLFRISVGRERRPQNIGIRNPQGALYAMLGAKGWILRQPFKSRVKVIGFVR